MEDVLEDVDENAGSRRIQRRGQGTAILTMWEKELESGEDDAQQEVAPVRAKIQNSKPAQPQLSHRQNR